MNPWNQLMASRPAPRVRSRGREMPPTPPKLKVGEQVGEWTLLEYIPGKKSKSNAYPRVKPRWRCVCSCGVEREVASDNLTYGLSKSCGCARKSKNWLFS